jgi:hypothetical protein
MRITTLVRGPGWQCALTPLRRVQAAVRYDRLRVLGPRGPLYRAVIHSAVRGGTRAQYVECVEPRHDSKQDEHASARQSKLRGVAQQRFANTPAASRATQSPGCTDTEILKK